MKKEWRAELRGLLKQKRSILRDGKRALWQNEHTFQKARRDWYRENQRIEKQTLRACGRVDQRIAVLEGRFAQ